VSIVLPLRRGLHGRRHCEYRRSACTGGMRHYRTSLLCVSFPPGVLSGGMALRAAAAALVARTRLASRLLPLDLRTLSSAVALTVIASPANDDGDCASLTVVESKAPFAHPPAFPHSTGQYPCEAGIKDPRNRLAQASVNRGPGAEWYLYPGLRLLAPIRSIADDQTPDDTGLAHRQERLTPSPSSAQSFSISALTGFYFYRSFTRRPV
jgi:hypothetical protein